MSLRGLVRIREMPRCRHDCRLQVKNGIFGTGSPTLRHTLEFKHGAARLTEANSCTVAQVEDDLGVERWSLRPWKRQFQGGYYGPVRMQMPI